MMQLLCNGVLLDLYDNAGLQFTHNNPLFAFDKLECERTTQFKLPCTPTNDAVFALARVPAYAGTGMRRKFAAELQAGTVIKKGYLYISKFDGTDYEAIFVTGEFIGLQAVKNLGKIADLVSYSDTVVMGATPVSPGAAINTDWANVAYGKPNADRIKPSILLQSIYDDICAAHNIWAQAWPASLTGLRWVVGKAKGVKQSMQFKCEITDITQPLASPANNYNSVQFDATMFEAADPYLYMITLISVHQYYKVVQYKARTNCKIVFPQDWPNNMYMVDLSGNSGDHYAGGDSATFYGDRWFEVPVNGSVTPQGDPLAGRTIQLNAGDCFSFVASDCYVNRREQILGEWKNDVGFMLDDAHAGYAATYAIEVQSVSDDVPTGDICRMQDNLPDITFTEFLKMIAALAGCVLNYTDANGIVFEPLNVAGYTTHELSQLTKRSEVSRTFSDYAQHNYVKFKSADYVLEKLTVDYAIDNDNLDVEKTLLTIPCSEGREVDGNLYIEGDEPTVGTGTGALLARVALPRVTGLQTLCNMSTQIKVSARLTLAKYDAIAATAKILCDNTQYVWTQRSWQDDVGTFTLAKVL